MVFKMSASARLTFLYSSCQFMCWDVVLASFPSSSSSSSFPLAQLWYLWLQFPFASGLKGGNVNKIYEHLWSVPLRCVMILCGDVTFFLVLLPLGLAESLDRRRPCGSAGSSIEYLHWTLLAGNIRSSALSLMYVKNVGLPCLLSRPTAPGRSVCPKTCVITVCMCIGRTRR